jgi:hypothetical protein
VERQRIGKLVEGENQYLREEIELARHFPGLKPFGRESREWNRMQKKAVIAYLNREENLRKNKIAPGSVLQWTGGWGTIPPHLRKK